jgi:hypothetical protein
LILMCSTVNDMNVGVRMKSRSMIGVNEVL